MPPGIPAYVLTEHGDRYLRVIYNPNVAPWRVVTAYFDRGLRGE